MRLNDYQAEAMGFRLPSATPEYALINLSGEVGELHSLIAKAIRDGAKYEFEMNVKKELADILWCLSAVAADYGWTLEDVAVSNINKLSQRKDNRTIQGSGDNR